MAVQLGAVFGAIAKQVVLGAGIAAGQAIVETGQQLTVNALTAKLQSWGVNIDSNSPLGMLFDNFKSNLSVQFSNSVFQASNTLFDSALDNLEEQKTQQFNAMNDALVEAKSTIRSRFLDGGKKFCRSLFTLDMLNRENYIFEKGEDAVQVEVDKEMVKINPQLRVMYNEKADLSMKYYSGITSSAGHYVSGVGTSTSGFNSLDISDDIKMFDAVMMLMNMKKVG